MTSNRTTRTSSALLISLLSVTALTTGLPLPGSAQVPTSGEVRQLVTFRFLPGRAGEATAIFREQAVPLYREDTAMLSFRAFREVESPVPLDLVVVSSFRGMAGMDESNEALRRLAAAAGTGIGAIYGGIAALSESHHDQFVEMRSALVNGDPASKPLVAFVWYRTEPGREAAFERTLEDAIVVWERARGIPSSTGRFLVADDWSYLRVLGFDSLGSYQSYWTEVRSMGGHDRVDAMTLRRREVILAPVPDLGVR